MKVVRTFHPVGQGAFYSERFYEEDNPQAKYNIVYDCGTSWGAITKAKKVVNLAFDKNDTIDYLFISHLDFDHVSLANTLIESVDGKVRNIVLPLVYKEEVRIGINLNYIANHQETETFLRWILNRVDGNNNGIDTRITFIGSNDDKGNVTAGGEKITLQIEEGEPEWVLIPRNISAMSRRKELLEKFDRMLSDPDFKEESIRSGLPVVGSSDELLHLLLDERYVAGIIRNKKLRKAIKSAYEKVAGGVNVNSLLLYSGPAREGLNYMMCLMYSNMFKRMRFRRVGCLYTGDSDCDIYEWKSRLYSDVWQNIGTVQLPHHGSLKSFEVKKNDIDRVYYFPVSCGSTNSYGHPSGKILAYLMKKDGLPHIVTEMANTVCIQEIVRW
ncbi:hypothetical protein CIK90_11815 [Prevotella sp. P5-126]|uniref:MBL fold metallo-hydrolase n=1 Tax=Prevotella sp. P5-126 TaxID=2024216 RepID=UPI000B971530|nr:MBL fold metallo-hydrolase [Prevotella sp. P5-126]OYP35395.1 hypothetical protein CIK90_11815 [Prevotella sp. P5-126]